MIKAMQEIVVEFDYSSQQKMKNYFSLKEDSGKL